MVGDGASVFFVSDPDGISNVYRLDVQTGSVRRVTDVAGGVAGLTAMSPALSLASRAPVLAFSVYRAGKYQIDVLRGKPALAGEPLADHGGPG